MEGSVGPYHVRDSMENERGTSFSCPTKVYGIAQSRRTRRRRVAGEPDTAAANSNKTEHIFKNCIILSITHHHRRIDHLDLMRHTNHSHSTVKEVVPLSQDDPRWRRDLGTPFILPDNHLRPGSSTCTRWWRETERAILPNSMDTITTQKLNSSRAPNSPDY